MIESGEDPLIAGSSRILLAVGVALPSDAELRRDVGLDEAIGFTSGMSVAVRSLGGGVRRVIVDRTKRIFDDFFKVDEAYLRYERFDSTMSPVVRRLNFERGDSVAALIFKPETRRIVLVNQFKYPTYQKGPGWITETMAGMVDDGEDPETAVRREILEETGYSPRRLEHISTFYLSPGGTSERIILYYAEVDDEKTSAGGGLAEEGEDIVNVELSVEDALAQVSSGEIADAKTIIAILWLKDRLAGRNIA